MAKLIMWNLATLDGYFEGPAVTSAGSDVCGDELEQLSPTQGNAAARSCSAASPTS